MDIESFVPSDASEDALNAFITLVNDAGEVSAGLDKRISSAHRLLFLHDQGVLQGVAAIKRPKTTYRHRVFEKSGHVEAADRFTFELGWICVAAIARGSGLSKRLVAEALRLLEGASVFATTRTDNIAMTKVLVSFGFEKIGTPYASVQTPNANIQLFIKD